MPIGFPVLFRILRIIVKKDEKREIDDYCN